MADAQNTHTMFSYSKRNEETESKSQNCKKKKPKKPKYILHPYKEEESGDKLIILEPQSNSPNARNTRSIRSRSAGTPSKSKIKMKKPKKHRFYLKNKNKLSLTPSDSDRTNTTTNYKKSYHANQRKKRLFGIDNDRKIISLHLNNDKNDSINSNISDISSDNNCNIIKQNHITTDDNSLNHSNRPSLSLRPTQSNPKPNSKYNRNSELMSLGIGGTFTDYNINDIIIQNNCTQYKNEIINIPNINKQLFEWSCLEVCSWILGINNKYNKYIKSFIINNINGKALNHLTFVNIMKLTKYQINVNECTNLLNEIELLKNNIKIPTNDIPKQVGGVSDKQLKLGMIESSDDIDIPLFSTDNNSNEIVIEQGRFWRLFYFPKCKLLQYEVDKPVNKWTPYEVSLWINDVFAGKFSMYSHYFIQFQIDGQSLLNITRKCATNNLKMISPNIRRLFFDELRALSTLKQCNIRQNQQIKANTPTFSHRFTHDIIKFDPQISITSDGSPSIKSENNDQIVAAKAQKIVKDIHKKNSTITHIVADLTKRSSRSPNNGNNNGKLHNFISDQEDDDNGIVIIHCEHLTKDEIDFYNDTNLHFVEYENEKNNQQDDNIIMDPNNKPAPSIGALFDKIDANMLSDDVNIEQLIKDKDNDKSIAMNIGMVANINNNSKSTSLLSDNSVISNDNNSINTKIEKITDITKDSRQSSYNTATTLSSPKGSNTLLINLTTHENKTSLLVEGSYSNDSLNINNINNNNIKKRTSDNRNIHHSFEQYTDDINAPFEEINDIDEHDDLEIDIWDDKNTTNHEHVIIDSFMDIDDGDPLFNESLSPKVSINSINKNNNYGVVKNKTMTSISFAFDDEEKMNELDKQSIQLFHEANLTLELNQPISDQTDENNNIYNNNNNYNNYNNNNISIDIYN